MGTSWLVFILWSFLFPSISFAGHNRKIQLSESDVHEVRTALGYSTLLEFDSRPTGAILGDQDAFKVEYLGNSISIKPLFPSSKTNLFVFTDYEKFNFRLSTGSASHVDYSVRVKRKSKKEAQGAFRIGPAKIPSVSELSEISVGRKVDQNGLTLTLLSIAVPVSRAAYVVRFSIASGGAINAPVPLKNDDITVVQSGKNIPIHNLYLERSELSPNSSVTGVLVFRASKVTSVGPVFLEISPTALKWTKSLRIPLPIDQKIKRGKRR